MKWGIGGLVFSLGFALLGFGQGLPLADVVEVQPLSGAVELPSKGSSTVTLRLSILPGWHINSPKPSGVLIPTELSFSLPDGIETKPAWPLPKEVKVSFSPKPLALYLGEVEVPIRFTAGKDVPPGNYTIQGKLVYQACNDEVCLPPAENSFTVSLTVLPPRVVPIEAIASEGGGDVGRRLIWGLITAFLLGLGLNLTPCVYPMIPIAVAYFSRQSEARVPKIIALALSYQLGIALTYSALGVAAALSGGMLGELLQRSWLLALAAGVIAVFATSFLGLWHLRPPAVLVQRLPRGRGGGAIGAFLMGAFVGVIAAPCVGPVTVALLSYVASSQDALRGGALFFALSLGLGAPYVVLALLAGRVKRLPRAGPWTTWVERLLGILLIALSWYLVLPLLPSRAWLWGAAALAAGGAVYLFFVGKGIPGRVFKVLRWTVVLLGLALACFLILPKGTPSPSLTWTPYSAGVFTQIREQERPVLLYFSANWCLPCKELSSTTFRDPEVLSVTSGIALIKVDLTTAEDQAAEELRRSFGVVGVPTLIILGPEGNELWRNVGYITASDLIDALKSSLKLQ